jgi:ubiquinone/menaquinone biosynthesis C-methylase UbiE
VTHTTRDQRLKESQHVYPYMPCDDEIARLTREALVPKIRADTWDGFEWLRVGRGSRVLEIGCGGSYLAPLLTMRGAEVVGCDISLRGAEVAQKIARQLTSGGGPSFVLADATQLAFADASFDGVYGSGVLHHLPLAAARGEILRVLKPGGNAFFVEPLIHNPLLKLYRRLNRAKYTPGERPLSFDNVDQWSLGFSSSDHREYQLLSILAHMLEDRAPRAAVHWLETADSLLRRGPKILRKQFRYVLIRLTR